MTLADCAYPQPKERVRFLGRLCMDARTAVTTEAQTTAATAIGDRLEDLEPAACQFELAVVDMHDPSEGGARVDLTVLAMTDYAAIWIYNSLI